MRPRLTRKLILSSEDVNVVHETVVKPGMLNAGLERAIARYWSFVNSKQLQNEVQEKIEASTR